MTNKDIATKAFDDWADGTGYVTSIFADEMTWEIVGESAASGKYPDKQAFIDQVLHPFGERFGTEDPFRPVKIRGIFEDGDTVIVLWDGAGTTIDNTPYTNTYAWIMRFTNGRVIDGVAFYDSISFNRLWNTVTPPEL